MAARPCFFIVATLQDRTFLLLQTLQSDKIFELGIQGHSFTCKDSPFYKSFQALGNLNTAKVLNLFQRGKRPYTSECDVFRCQILMHRYKDDLRTEFVLNISSGCRPIT